MTISRVSVKALAGLALVVGFSTAARAQLPVVTVEGAIQRQPKQQGVNITTPTPDQVPRCKVSPIPNPKDPKQPMGYLVTDANNNPVRQFVSYDNKNFNIIAFYLDGVEAYREVYQPDTTKPHQFRWLGPNGTKWGLDHNHDGVIDEWVVISPEEASQELLRAVASRDPKRLEALLITADNLKTLGLPAAEADRMKARAATAVKRLSETADSLKLSDKAKWVHVEYGVPQTRPADSFNGTEDYTAYKNGTILIEDNSKNVFLQTGELVQVGRAWKIVDGPSTGDSTNDAAPLLEPQLMELVGKLNDLDKKPPSPPTVEALGRFNAQRADLLEQIVTKASETKKEPWVKMLLDAHAAAAEGGKPGNPNLGRLREWKEAFARPGNNPLLAAYSAFRLLQAEQSVALANIKSNEEFGPIQEKWRTGLEDFLKAYPNTPDSPEAAWRLAMAWELSGAKESDAKAKQWFEYVVKNYPTHVHATKAAGALKRLDSEGKPLELSGPLLSNPAQQFNAAQKDKVVVVYYWASWSNSLPEDAKKLDALAKAYGPKGVVIVTVGLDHDAKTASDAAASASLPGTHLYAPGGLDNSPLAATYGILAPPHLIVAGKDGKIVNRNAPLAGLEEELKKLTTEK
jgi:thiol-disulfide isomerase/thioredoxin